jgi:Methyltransferase domain
VAGAARRRVAALVRPVVASPTQPGDGVPRPPVGMVEQFSKRLVVGWLSVPRDAGPVRVTLHLGPLQVASTYATPGSSMSGVGSVLRQGAPSRSGSVPTPGAAPGAPLVHQWQVPNIPGPRDDRRNSARGIRTFSFRVRGIWPYVKKTTRISVRVNGQPLPIYGHGMFLRPPRRGSESLGALREKLDQGYVLSQYGQLQLSKQLDVVWQRQVMKLYEKTRTILAEVYGYDVFFVYGTLLGAVREGGYIGHDVDFDAAYVSRHTNGKDAGQELQAVALALVERGFDVQCMSTALHIHDPEDPEARIDLFHTYFDDNDELSFPFGIAGTSRIRRDDWAGTREIEFPGGKGLVPVNAEQLVEHLYGTDWRQPKPGFNWNLDRTRAAKAGTLSPEQRAKVYWANFYARTEYAEGSTFFDFVNSRSDTPDAVIDIGCGDGRDSRAFGAAGRTVLGVDQSEVGVEHARAQAEAAGLLERVSFEVCDVSDADRLSKLFSERQAASSGPVLFYMRFFLHSIPEDVQETLMGVVRDCAGPGDLLAAEFRTQRDAEKSKVHRKHYRRFQDGELFGKRLATDFGFTVLHEEEGTGLSPYRGEDPVLYRVVARR